LDTRRRPPRRQQKRKYLLLEEEASVLKLQCLQTLPLFSLAVMAMVEYRSSSLSL
jgi:hypothetical protein